ncbi:RNA-directed DNA polymerase from transposon BS [Paramuricea clavata]|uniref:RNA-directed DNA polymerase from transposon BS n=1 Tax=Paramuricea clavata TaxID=317549 RepID=A0A7D9L132_PARCT|nr:RNA-directed DNA polymerase from transposon BS [Paramuricea clavata]
MVCIELSLPYNKSLLISTWYRPPNSLMNKFDYWASFLAKCDNEDKELILIGDLNCDVSKTIPDPHTCKLQFLCSLYQIDQLIKESTRLTPKSATLIDLILTTRPENISRSGVIHLGISDHSLVYAVRKFTLPNGRQKIRQVRNFKNFVENDFIRDVSQLPWEMVYQFGDPNLCWQVWKSLLLDALIDMPLCATSE